MMSDALLAMYSQAFGHLQSVHALRRQREDLFETMSADVSDQQPILGASFLMALLAAPSARPLTAWLRRSRVAAG